MREIRFKFWDTKAKTMYPHWAEFAIYGTRVHQPTTHGMDECPHVIPLQFTGLKDKNGVEIYEENIIKDPAPDLIARHDYVLFKDGSFIIDNGLVTENMDSFFIEGENNDCVQVIGNIYENPELLGEES